MMLSFDGRYRSLILQVLQDLQRDVVRGLYVDWEESAPVNSSVFVEISGVELHPTAPDGQPWPEEVDASTFRWVAPPVSTCIHVWVRRFADQEMRLRCTRCSGLGVVETVSEVNLPALEESR